MAETAFEATLAGLYAASPAYGDADAFLAGLTERLERNGRLRGWVIGGLGMSGAVVATAAFAGSDIPGRLYGWITAMPAEVTLLGVTALTVAMLLAAGAMILTPVVVGSVAEA